MKPLLTTLALLFYLPIASYAVFDWFRSDEDVDYSVPTREELDEADRLYSEALDEREAGNSKAALRPLRKILLDYSNTPFAGDALFLAAEIEMEQGDLEEAFKNFQKIVNRYPGYERFNAVIANQFEIASMYMGGASSNMFGFEQPDTAIEYFEVVIKNSPYSDYAPLALMNIALISQQKSDEELAIDALDRLITLYPRSLLTPDAYFAMAQIFASLIQGPEYDQGSTLEALNYYQDFLILFPRSQYVDDAEEGLRQVSEIYAQSKLMTAEFYYVNRHNEEAARVFYNETITVAPETEAADIARQRIQRMDEGRSPPRFKIKPKSDDIHAQVQQFFNQRWRARDLEDLQDDSVLRDGL
ncbi:MAG: outer membrane protein assembly factor BamD [Verrucomicrobiota bacterium]